MSERLSGPPPYVNQTLHVLQLNTCRSSAVVHSLLNDPATTRSQFLLIQEPYIYSDLKLPLTHPSWTPVLPQLPDDAAGAGPEDTTIKSLIYVNKIILSTALTPVPTL